MLLFWKFVQMFVSTHFSFRLMGSSGGTNSRVALVGGKKLSVSPHSHFPFTFVINRPIRRGQGDMSWPITVIHAPLLLLKLVDNRGGLTYWGTLTEAFLNTLTAMVIEGREELWQTKARPLWTICTYIVVQCIYCQEENWLVEWRKCIVVQLCLNDRKSGWARGVAF